MEAAFGIVVFVVVGVAAVIALISLIGVRRTYDEIGHGGLSLRDGSDGEHSAHGPMVCAVGERATPPVSAAVREEEIRQLVQARSDRRVRRGEPPLDVAAQVRRLIRADGPAASTGDPGLQAEIRDMVVARNARLTRAGRPTLDVDAETERRIRELDV